ncbi:MAG: tRNA preQ1(34) S-adenosylmethionine ribosyltransferase-isomerase QueA [Patescibacteria group bacterium]|nr:tRNA preQ1(34) S-adenosylmethionine ribosyltransferase-isomerase QueA [Patescibacteria group bacterium]
MLTQDFWYELPPERIAQAPIRPRDHSKLMVLDCGQANISHRHFYDLSSLLKPGDLLVLNDTKVFKARLKASFNQKDFEVFLLRPEGSDWLAMVKGLKKISLGDALTFDEEVKARLVKKLDDGSVLLHFELDDEKVFAFTDRHGQVPTPPYVAQSDSLEDYQTVYADKIGSAAAPTAGFHFTPELIETLKTKGVNFGYVTLHVGLGTFKPITAEDLEDHIMHEEWVNVPREILNLINETKRRGGRVIAVGTTSVRSLESDVQNGFTNIFIKPGYKFKIVDALITNFHLPVSTLIVLVSAFAQNKMSELDAGRKFILETYGEAIKNNYRFYSFGDAMFIE